MDQLLDSFLTYLTVEKGLSKNTLESYGRDVRKFVLYLEENKISSVHIAASEKGCSRQAIYRALDEDRLSEIRLGRIRLVVRDELYLNFLPRPYRDLRLNSDDTKSLVQ
ncbi:MAG: site-specific integrase [Candidatus Dadabacteria bacterium]|nr:site-specific integrase [Candidatus Dadabacteria bacterium]